MEELSQRFPLLFISAALVFIICPSFIVIPGARAALIPPAKFDGFVYKNHRATHDDSIVIEAFFDPVCPDSRDAWPPLKRALQHYGSRVSLIVHPFALPYHDNAYVACRALHIVNELNASATYHVLELFFKHQGLIKMVSEHTWEGRIRSLNVPIFSGDNPDDWVSRTEAIFAANRWLSEEEKIEAASEAMRGDACAWFLWEERCQFFRWWAELKHCLLRHFRPIFEAELCEQRRAYEQWVTDLRELQKSLKDSLLELSIWTAGQKKETLTVVPISEEEEEEEEEEKEEEEGQKRDKGGTDLISGEDNVNTGRNRLIMAHEDSIAGQKRLVGGREELVGLIPRWSTPPEPPDEGNPNPARGCHVEISMGKEGFCVKQGRGREETEKENLLGSEEEGEETDRISPSLEEPELSQRKDFSVVNTRSSSGVRCVEDDSTSMLQGQTMTIMEGGNPSMQGKWVNPPEPPDGKNGMPESGETVEASSGENPDGWVLNAERTVTSNHLSEPEKMESAAMAMKGEALAWLRWRERGHALCVWDSLKLKLLDRCRPTRPLGVAVLNPRRDEDGAGYFRGLDVGMGYLEKGVGYECQGGVGKEVVGVGLAKAEPLEVQIITNQPMDQTQSVCPAPVQTHIHPQSLISSLSSVTRPSPEPPWFRPAKGPNQYTSSIPGQSEIQLTNQLTSWDFYDPIELFFLELKERAATSLNTVMGLPSLRHMKFKRRSSQRKMVDLDDGGSSQQSLALSQEKQIHHWPFDRGKTKRSLGNTSPCGQGEVLQSTNA